MHYEVSPFVIHFWSSPIGWVPMAFPADHSLDDIKKIGRALADDYPPEAIGVKLLRDEGTRAWEFGHFVSHIEGAAYIGRA